MMTKEVPNHGVDTPILHDAAWVDAYRVMALGITTEVRERHEVRVNTPGAAAVTENGLLLRQFRA